MKATLTFDLSGDDKIDFDNALKATDYYLALNKIQEFLRAMYKHESKWDADTIDEVRSRFFQVLKDYEVNV